jgi:polyribonucleotide nucleotidyltransferase
MPESKHFSTAVGGKTIALETGKLALQAGGAVTIRQADTWLLGAATMSHTPREGIDFFPLTVDYEERLYETLGYRTLREIYFGTLAGLAPASEAAV